MRLRRFLETMKLDTEVVIGFESEPDRVEHCLVGQVRMEVWRRKVKSAMPIANGAMSFIVE